MPVVSWCVVTPAVSDSVISVLHSWLLLLAVYGVTLGTGQSNASKIEPNSHTGTVNR